MPVLLSQFRLAPRSCRFRWRKVVAGNSGTYLPQPIYERHLIQGPLNCQVPKVLPTAENYEETNAHAHAQAEAEADEAAHLLRLCQYLATDLHEIINRI